MCYFPVLILSLSFSLPPLLTGTSADREIQRTLMELLNQMDGFDVLGKVQAGEIKEGRGYFLFFFLFSVHV